MAPTDLLVCTRCRLAGEDPGEAHLAARAGARLHRALVAAARQAGAADGAADGAEGVAVASVACLSACKRGCAVALMAPGKASLLFGDLRPEDAADILAAARAHAARADGFLPRAARPERLRAGILARLPAPPHRVSADAYAWPAA